MIPGNSVREFELPPSGAVAREMLPAGGHVSFAAATRAPSGFWAAGRALEFLDRTV